MSISSSLAIAVKAVSLGLLATIEECGSLGANDEMISLALVPYGTSERHCRFFVETMRSGGLIVLDDQACFQLTEQGRIVKGRLSAEIQKIKAVLH